MVLMMLKETIMEAEIHNGKTIVVRHKFDPDEIEVGSMWMSSGNNVVTVTENDGEWITYQWEESAGTKYNSKDYFAFQCRYCLIID
jgi:hypothetical protein